MPPKPLEPLARRLMKGVIVVELLGVLGAYALFHRMNNSREFRSTMNDKFPSVLEGKHGSERGSRTDRSGRWL
uniref:CEBPZ opposite strand n=1 Tax=Cyprinodon variegatus TaxID=28743 RepID=A0A3Q2GGE4_CYPVA